jgi:hypothetical protein
MLKPFPQFPEPSPLPAGGSWTAEFVSYDMRLDTACYFVSRQGASSGQNQYFVRLHVSGGYRVDADLRVQLERQVEIGEPNTDHEGSMMWPIRRKKPQESEQAVATLARIATSEQLSPPWTETTRPAPPCAL